MAEVERLPDPPLMGNFPSVNILLTFCFILYLEPLGIMRPNILVTGIA